jgi:hypothetical protein
MSIKQLKFTIHGFSYMVAASRFKTRSDAAAAWHYLEGGPGVVLSGVDGWIDLIRLLLSRSARIYQA